MELENVVGILNTKIPYTDPKDRQQLRQALLACRRLAEGIPAITVTFNAATSKGQPVYLNSSGVAILGRANAASTSLIAGLAGEDVGASGSGELLASGLITLADWTSIAGTTSLAEESEYFLSPSTAGIITTTKPTTVGQVVASLGRPVNSTTLNILLAQPILL